MGEGCRFVRLVIHPAGVRPCQLGTVAGAEMAHASDIKEPDRRAAARSRIGKLRVQILLGHKDLAQVAVALRPHGPH